MAEPALVGDCVAAMLDAVRVPVTVKCRLGVDEQDPEVALEAMTQAVEAGRRPGPHRARPQGLAHGLSPRRTARSPLDYARVHRLKAGHLS